MSEELFNKPTPTTVASWHKLHRSSLIQPLLIIASVFVLALWSDLTNLLGTAIGVGVAVFIRWWINFGMARYQISPDHVVLRKGVLKKVEQIVPFERMHDVNTVQDAIQRRFGIVTIQIQTAGGSGVDLELKGVKLAVVDELRELKRAHDSANRNSAVDDLGEFEAAADLQDSADNLLLELSWLDCLKLSVLRNPALAILMAGFFYVYNKLSDQIRPRIIAFAQRYETYAEVFSKQYMSISFSDRFIPWVEIWINFDANWLPLLMVVFAGVLILVVFVVGLSFLIMLALYRGFALQVLGDVLIVRAGSFVRTERKTPLSRIQFTRVIRTFRHRLMGVDSVYFNTSAASDNKGLVERMLARWLTPVSTPTQSRKIIESVFTSISLEHGHWLGIETRAWKRRFKKRVLFFLPLAGMLVLTSFWLLPLVALVVVFLAFEARRFVQRVAFQISPDAILINKGWWVRTATIVPLSKVQTIVVKQTLFDRRHRMATLVVNTASDTSKLTAEIPYLDFAIAHSLANRIYAEVQHRELEW